ncbi:TetR/AcrR family transcriptional regulator [Nonomuraea sp. NPDC050790]|uniref:TetR/AcrR family transcriptional regulator n=1 Tax=Nonomuraea sp. NPDC050790 TaxID=3364371 RepID=UPI003791D24A
MPSDGTTTAGPSLRERRRGAAVEEIMAASERHLDAHGPAGLSLRAVARSLGMTVQALYHYFPRREDLITALITKAYGDLADAVEAAAQAPPDDPAVPGLVAAAEGFRRWAVTHPERFQLIYGTPLRDYAAPPEGETTRSVRRMSATFRRELLGAYTLAQLAACESPELSPGFRTHLEALPPDGLGTLPAPAAALFLSAWGHMYGLVALEVFGHTAFVGEHQAELFRVAMLNLVADTTRRMPAG